MAEEHSKFCPAHGGYACNCGAEDDKPRDRERLMNELRRDIGSLEVLCADLSRIATNTLAAANARIAELEAENIRIRAALAFSKDPCVYCKLPAEEWARCQHGFPGCERADDAIGCPHLGAALELEKAEAEVTLLRGTLAARTEEAEQLSIALAAAGSGRRG